MSVGRLYGPKVNGRIYKVRLVAKLNNLQIDYDDSFTFGVHNKSADFLAKFPLGQTPAFESTDGLLLTESNAIAFYLAHLKEGSALLGKDKKELAKIYQYSFFAETQVMPHILTILMPSWGYAPYSQEVEKAAYQKLEASLDYLNKELENKNHFIGNDITLADIVIAEDLNLAFSSILDEPLRAKYPHLTKFFTNYRSKAEIKEITGEAKFAEKPLKVEPKA